MAEGASRHLERLAASPRPAGSPAEAAARRYCGEVLTSLGFSVAEERFEYSAAPGRWATPAGGVMSILVLGVAGHLGSRGRSTEALIVLVVALVVAIPASVWVARRGVLDLPLLRASGVNLRATRGKATPLVWLVAHLDSKSQPVPTALRALGIVASAWLWMAAIGVAVAQWQGADVASWWPWISVAALAAGAPVAASVVGSRSPGALDNASGVATVLVAAAKVRAGSGVGILLTSAEELGLAGARAWVRSRPAGIALNCDGVDDRGRLVCMPSGGRSSSVVAAMKAGALAAGAEIQVRALVPGLLVDASAFADAGWEAATLSRGDWSTLLRVHRPGDDLHHLTGAGVDEASTVLAAAAGQLSKGG
jgi:hypothetical protein